MKRDGGDMRRRLAEPARFAPRRIAAVDAARRSSRPDGAARQALRLFGQGACLAASPPVHYGLRLNN